MHRWCQQSVTRFTGSPTRSVSRLNSAWQRTSACTAWHHLISPDSVHHLPSWPAAHNCALLINTNCLSLVRLPPRWVLWRSAYQAHLRGTHFLGSFPTQPSPSTFSDNPSKPICLTVINLILLSHVLWALSPHALSWQFLFSWHVWNDCLLTYLLTYLTLPYSSILLPSIEVTSCPSACTLGLLKHFHRYCLKADKVSKNAGTGKIEYFWKCADAVYQKLSKLVYSCWNCILPKLAHFYWYST